MTLQFTLLTAVVILKAFFGWIRTPEIILASGSLQDDEKAATSRHVIVLFHAYVFGNLLSLLTAMILGHGALVLAKLLDKYL